MLTSCTVAMRSKKKTWFSVFDSVALYVLVGVVPAVFQKDVCISNTLRPQLWFR